MVLTFKSHNFALVVFVTSSSSFRRINEAINGCTACMLASTRMTYVLILYVLLQSTNYRHLYLIIKTSTLGVQGSSNRWQGTELPDEKTATTKTPWQVV
jgi:hypothetical protein